MTKNASRMFLLLLLLTISLHGISTHLLRSSLAQVTHDIAIISVTPSLASVRLNDTVSIAVLVKNQGTETESFTVTAYYNSVPIEAKPITDLQPNLDTTLVFTWNTTGLGEAIYATAEKEISYTIKASTSVISGETDTSDNELSSAVPVRVLMHYIAVIPQRTLDTSLTSGMTYTVSIYTDYEGTDVWSWQFLISYNPVILEGIEVSNGDLISTAKHPNATFIAGTFDNTQGKLSATAAYFAYTPPEQPFTTSGPGTMAHLTFRVKTIGESNLTLTERETQLIGPGGATQEIINWYTPTFDHILYGSFRNTEAQIVHDLAIVSVTPSTTSVAEGELVSIAVVVENQGTVAELFDLKLYYAYNPQFPGSSVIGQQTAQSLEVDADKTLAFSWNTTGVNAQSYSLTAVIPTVAGEADTADNVVQSAQAITVTAEEAQPLPITAIVVGLVIGVVAIVVIALLLRRRKKPLPEEE